MNGEDTDLTMQIGRLGYRAVVTGESVRARTCRAPSASSSSNAPGGRGLLHVYARHVPLRSGFAGPRVWLWTMRRGFGWFTLPAGLIAPIFMLELTLTHPDYRQNVATFALLYVAGGAVPLAISLPLAIKYRCWRSIAWSPTWFAFAFLRRLAALEAAISLPTRPCRWEARAAVARAYGAARGTGHHGAPGAEIVTASVRHRPAASGRPGVTLAGMRGTGGAGGSR